MQQLAYVYLSMENYNILDDELKKKFNVDIKTVSGNNKDEKKDYLIRICESVKTLYLEEIKRSYELKEKDITISFVFNIAKINLEKYKSLKVIKRGLDNRFGPRELNLFLMKIDHIHHIPSFLKFRDI